MSSPYLTVSSLVLFDITLLSPPASLTLLRVDPIVVQSFEIHYPNARVARPPPQRLPLLCVEQSPPSPVPPPLRSSPTSLPPTKQIEEDGKEWNQRILTRLPNDEYTRPTTLPGAHSRIRVSHALGIEIKFQTGTSIKAETVQLTNDVCITSVSSCSYMRRAQRTQLTSPCSVWLSP
jgi:hypothetical protein